MPGVLGVVKDELREVDTATTPDFLGISKPGGVWSMGYKGENVIIGVDRRRHHGRNTPASATAPTSTATARKDGKLGYQQIPGWNGRCVPGEAFNGSDCNQKLIGAQLLQRRVRRRRRREGRAALRVHLAARLRRSRYAHGIDRGRQPERHDDWPGRVLGTISGIAPRARIAAYKVCWGVGGTANAGCFTTDSVAAIDQAVSDGVDVINFSISGSRTNFRDPVEIAWLFAARRGRLRRDLGGQQRPDRSALSRIPARG